MNNPKQRRTTRASTLSETPLFAFRDPYSIEVSRRTALLTAVLLASSTVCSTASLADSSTSLDNISSSRIEALRNVRVITFLIPSSGADEIRSKFGSKSPVGNPSILEAVQQLSRKATWFADGLVYTEVISIPADTMDDDSTWLVQDLLLSTNVLVAVGLKARKDLDFAQQIFMRRLRDKMPRQFQCQFGIDCAMSLLSFVGPYSPFEPGLQSSSVLLLPWTKESTAKRLHKSMSKLFSRWNSGDFVLSLMLFINQFSPSGIDLVRDNPGFSWEKGLVRNVQEMSMLVSKCGYPLRRCLFDSSCRTAVQALAAIDSRDQSTSYRTIVSCESDLLRDVSFCMMQENNIFKCDATIPRLPRVEPLQTFRGRPVTEDIARRILIGNLDEASALEGSLRSRVSWAVACGDSEAYSMFPFQQQLFYPASRGRGMWYDPIFLVQTLDGRSIWCKRHYRGQPDKLPGMFRFSDMDNGIISNELWTIVAVADDLSWIVLHYAGAAAAVGQRFMGVLLCTADGSLPNERQLSKVWKAVASAGVQPWELVVVDNDKRSVGYIEAGDPPLDFFRTEVVAKRSATAYTLDNT
jgi:VDE lipocalin domain